MRPEVRLLALGERGVGEALIVAQVEIGLRAVVGDEDLAVLEGAHGSRIDVEIRVEFLQGDFEAAAFEQAADGRRCDSLPERRDHAAGHEDVFSHCFISSPLLCCENAVEQLRALSARSSGVSTPSDSYSVSDYANLEAIFQGAQLLKALSFLERTDWQIRVPQQKVAAVDIEPDVFDNGPRGAAVRARTGWWSAKNRSRSGSGRSLL